MSDAVSTGANARMGAAPVLAAGMRLSEIDMLRGLVIVLMALDHVRDYFHVGAFRFDPLNPAQTTPLLYATRWITHFCAPTFVFLAGVSAWLQFAKGKSRGALSLFLLTRGLWLIVLEATVLSFGWSFGFPFPAFLQVIWAIGWSMIALAALAHLPRLAVLAIGIAIVAGHNLLDPIAPDQFGGAALFWTFFHEGGPIFVDGAPIGLFAYAVFPWFGIIALGYGMGALFTQPAARRNRALIGIGLAMIAAFFLLRGFNLYGDPAPENAGGPFAALAPWADQPNFTAKIMAFFDVQKYPPSLQFVLITLGPMLLLLPLLSRLRGPAANLLLTFGAVPFFFYVLHIYLVHLLAIAAHAMVGRDPSGLFNYLLNAFTAPERMQNLGFSLPYVYLAWVVVLALLYPLCRYWAALKSRRRDWWLSYL